MGQFSGERESATRTVAELATENQKVDISLEALVSTRNRRSPACGSPQLDLD
jgi:hypothetical protein